MITPVLRVLHVIDTLERAGAEQSLVAGLPRLRDHQIEPAVLAWKPPFTLAGELTELGIQVHPPADLRPEVLARYDVIHSHLPLSTMVSRVMSRVARRPIVTTLHGLDYSASGYGRWRLRWYADRLTSYLVPSTFVAVSEAVQRDYARHLRVPSIVIDNPVDVGWLDGLPTREEARAHLGLDPARPVALMIANLRRIKGHDVLAQAAGRCPGVSFVVAGRASEGERAVLGSRLRWLGSIDRDELRWWMAAADVGVIPSRVESFSLVAVEMMAARLPVIASDIPGLGETVGALAYKVPPGDPVALADAIERALAGPGDHLSGLERSRLYTPSRWAERMSALYHQLAR